jgi:hypothetical protein
MGVDDSSVDGHASALSWRGTLASILRAGFDNGSRPLDDMDRENNLDLF